MGLSDKEISKYPNNNPSKRPSTRSSNTTIRNIAYTSNINNICPSPTTINNTYNNNMNNNDIICNNLSTAGNTTTPNCSSARRCRQGKHRLVQADLSGMSIPAKDSKSFGQPFPVASTNHTTLFTFQNCSPQPLNPSKSKAKHNAWAIRNSQAAVALIAEHGLNKSKLQKNKCFHAQIKKYNPSSFIFLTNNVTEAKIAHSQQWGGVGFIMNAFLLSQKNRARF